MSIQINNSVVIDDSKKGIFAGGVQLGTFTNATRPVSPTTGDLIFNTDLPGVQVWNGTIWEAVTIELPSSGNALTGGDIDGKEVVMGATVWNYHTFLSSGSLTVSEPTTVEILAVGGGGAGGYPESYTGPHNGVYGGGGGGAGGVVYMKDFQLEPGSYGVTVGAGGVDGQGEDTCLYSAATATNIIEAKGGSAGAYGLHQAYDGGSGGGGGGPWPGGNAIQPSTTQGEAVDDPEELNAGQNGFDNSGDSTSPGGGGGAGMNDAYTPKKRGGPGTLITNYSLDFSGESIGVPSLGTNPYFGGGGGGAYWQPGTFHPVYEGGRLGGIGGGGNGAYRRPSFQYPVGQGNWRTGGGENENSTAGQAYTGGGGGAGMGPAGGGPADQQYGKPGGSGIFVVRYIVS